MKAKLIRDMLLSGDHDALRVKEFAGIIKEVEAKHKKIVPEKIEDKADTKEEYGRDYI